MSIIENFTKKIEAERKIRIPRSILESNSVIELEKILNSSNPSKAFLLSEYYKNFDEKLNFGEIFMISKELKKNRNLSHSDLIFIKKIVEIKDYDSEFLFDIVGNLIHSAQLVDDMNECQNLTLNIEITIKLWSYLSFLELITKIFSEFLKSHINKNLRTSKRKKEFLKRFENGQHPTIGELINMLEELKLIDKNKGNEYFFIKSKLIRNKIAHNNIYFDNSEKCIFFSNGKRYELNEFYKDSQYLQDFILELVFQLNKEKNDIEKTIKKSFQELGKVFLRIQRNPSFRKTFNELTLEWKK